MCAYGGVQGADTTGAAGKLTTEMAGTGLSTLLGTNSTDAASHWVFTTDETATNNLYPRLSGIDETDTVKLSVSPVFLYVDSSNSSKYDTASEVKNDFTVSTQTP